MERAVSREDEDSPLVIARHKILGALVRSQGEGCDLGAHPSGLVLWHLELSLEERRHIDLQTHMLGEVVASVWIFPTLALLLCETTVPGVDLVHTEKAAVIPSQDEVLIMHRRGGNVRDGLLVASGENVGELSGRCEQPHNAISLHCQDQCGGHDPHARWSGRHGAGVSQGQPSDEIHAILLRDNCLGNQEVAHRSRRGGECVPGNL
mmetsp:Transcript_108686/g.232192  ORF Transcript_108686/g.232192 Transcript_108686/m.232192 type:complete len:207 (-) Transcript_108686:447-1067(-)